ncbi:MAG: hypothetical protein ABSA47_04755 [Verrucomicrobiota bacterium]
MKRDNGSPFNHEAVDQVLERHGVLPLNSPPRSRPYNGAMEKGIGDLKRQLDQRLHPHAPVFPNLRAQVEAVVHDLNQRPKRLLQGRTSCDHFHDQRRRLRLSKRGRTQMFRWLYQAFWKTIGYMPNRTHHQMEAAWRLTVESWLVCHGLISIRLNQHPKLSTNFPKNWSHNSLCTTLGRLGMEISRLPQLLCNPQERKKQIHRSNNQGASSDRIRG